jgi:hypothetical protein
MLGDFIFQSSDIAYKKAKGYKYLCLHSLIYAVCIFTSLLFLEPILISMLLGTIIVISHFLIDLARIKISNLKSSNSENKKRFDFILFGSDQILHVAILLLCSQFVSDSYSWSHVARNIVFQFFTYTQIYNASVIILLYTICLSPAAVLIKKVLIFLSIQQDDSNEGKTDLVNTGYLIGVLERIIILSLGLAGQIGAIGFILAAKSLARFKQLDDKQFAEKYLIGTLLSVTIALICFLIGNLVLIK